MVFTENSSNTIGFTYREIRLSIIMSCQHLRVSEIRLISHFKDKIAWKITFCIPTF